MHVTHETPHEAYTISEETFNIHQPYAEGHQITSGEASALNQVLAENVRNNLAKQIKAHKEAGTFDHASMQDAVHTYVAEYEFGLRHGGGGRTTDPVMAEAMDIARGLVKAALKRKNVTASAADISRLAKQAIESGKNPRILEEARERVQREKEIAGLELDSLSSDDEPKAKAKKATA